MSKLVNQRSLDEVETPMDKFSQSLRSHKEISFDYHSQESYSNNTLDLHSHLKES